MQYKVVPFPQSKDINSYLQHIIDTEVANGWKYVNHQYGQYSTSGSAGCFGFGASPGRTFHIGMIVFEKI